MNDGRVTSLRRPDRRRAVAVVGEFDGMHVGHRQLVADAGAVAGRLGRPLVGVVLVDRSTTEALTAAAHRCWGVMAAGCSSAGALSVDAGGGAAEASAVVDELVDRVDPAVVVLACTPGGTALRYPALREELLARGVEVVEVPRWTNPDGTAVTSEGIRAALRSGDVARAADWLGREYVLTGRVVHGSGLGRTIGFPTANLSLADGVLIPRRGVYAGHVRLPDGSRHRSAINIGVRPTVEEHGALLVEAHLLDFDGDLYEQSIDVGFSRWLREERTFGQLDLLVAQLERDVAQVRMVLRG